MKWLLIMLLFVSCMDDSCMTGYVVGKTFTPTHMSNETPKRVDDLRIIPYIHTNTAPPKPHYVHQEWKVWVANRQLIRSYVVDSTLYTSMKCGQFVAIGCNKK